jgi:hypothetical protein
MADPVSGSMIASALLTAGTTAYVSEKQRKQGAKIAERQSFERNAQLKKQEAARAALTQKEEQTRIRLAQQRAKRAGAFMEGKLGSTKAGELTPAASASAVKKLGMA